ncbi:hypothetical protein LEN26_016149 [Aphanomyces euteiches]|nr:hypothetical protein LEN26_016149 [Aphanomyces euteiches]KAH9102804.1 hypothetical protein AeMF1_020700 [Aphanomyces euteiches]KAH9188674.1 hypothetical protein AeNC1_009350 [Aphanomyces euteiches]
MLVVVHKTTRSDGERQDGDPKNVDIKYPTGDQAVLLDSNGCGFCYYESGRVAVCVSKVNAIQKRYYFYEGTTKRPSSMDGAHCDGNGGGVDHRTQLLLCSIDEHVVGSAGRPNGNKLVLTKHGAILSDAKNDIVKSWKWRDGHQNDPITIGLNDMLTFKFVDRKHISVKWSHPRGISLEFSCGEKLKRDDNYLDHSRRATHGVYRGKLVIDTSHEPSLVARQKQIEVTALEKRSKQHPRSNDLTHDAIKQVVSRLEDTFDDYQACRVTPFCTGSWLHETHNKTLAELPVLPKTGFEVGKEPTIYGQPMEPHTPTHVTESLQDKDGQWLSSLDIHHRLEARHPVLPRTAVLCNASGRYSIDIQVPGGAAQPEGKKLQRVSACRLDAFLKDDVALDQLVLVACLRDDDARSRQAEKTLELVHGLLESAKDHQQQAQEQLDQLPQSLVQAMTSDKFRLVKVDMAESREMAQRFRIHAVPTFLMFFESKLVAATSLGGQPIRLTPTTRNVHLTHVMDHPPRTLLVQAQAKQQVYNEKLLKKELFPWDLAMSAEQALQRIAKLSKAAAVNGVVPSYNLVLLSDDLGEADFRILERYFRTTDAKKAPNPAQECVVAMILTKPVFPFASTMCPLCRAAQGRRVSSALDLDDGVCPHCGIVPKSFVESTTTYASSIGAIVFVYRHLRAPTLHRLAERWHGQVVQTKSQQMTRGAELEAHKGLTQESLLKEMEQFLQAGRRGLFAPNDYIPPMALSATDTAIINTRLTSKPPHSA